MAFIPEVIINSAPGDSLRDGADKINTNFTAIQEELGALDVDSIVGDAIEGNTQTGIVVAYDDETGKLNFAVLYGTGTGTACEGNDSRLSDARPPTAHTHAEADINEKEALTGTVGEPSASNPFVTQEDAASVIIDIQADIMRLNYSPVAYTPSLIPSVSDTDQLSAHLAGIDSAMQSILARVADLEAAL